MINLRNLLSAALTFLISVNLFLVTTQKVEAQSWSALGSGMSSSAGNTGVLALDTLDGNLYAGGRFDSAGGNSANNIAEWNGTNWSTLGSGVKLDSFLIENLGIPSAINSIATYNGSIYAGGLFDTAGGIYASDIAEWNGANWSALGSGINIDANVKVETYNSIYALMTFHGNLYVGGEFDTVGGMPINDIAKWNGTNWDSVGSGLNGPVYTMTVYNGNLYVAGAFDTAGGVHVSSIAEWNGTNWSAVGKGETGFYGGPPLALTTFNNSLYAGGQFTGFGDVTTIDIAEWNGTNWDSVGNGMYGTPDAFVISLASSKTDLYAGGWFQYAGGITDTCLGEWNGTTWSPLGSGVNGTVSALIVTNNNLYAGGFFDTAGGKPASNVAEWSIPTGINQFSAKCNHLSIYPNPSNGSFTITSSKNIDELKVTNLLGQLIYEAQPKLTQFNFELKNAGMYFVTVTSDGESVTDKVVVTR